MSKISAIKLRAFQIIEKAEDGDTVSRLFDIGMMGLIVLNTAVILAGTFSAVPPGLRRFFSYVESISIIIFTIEYLLRLWTCDLLHPNVSKGRALIKYATSFMAIIDLLSILPFYLPLIMPINLSALRMLRLLRIMRIFKVSRYNDAVASIVRVFKSKAPQMLTSAFVIALLMLIASVLMFEFEHSAQPDVFTNVLDAFWWAIATLTTVGYGDIYPITAMGRALSSVIALLGIGFVALPTGILSAGFMEAVDGKSTAQYCPHCGKKLDS